MGSTAGLRISPVAWSISFKGEEWGRRCTFPMAYSSVHSPGRQSTSTGTRGARLCSSATNAGPESPGMCRATTTRARSRANPGWSTRMKASAASAARTTRSCLVSRAAVRACARKGSSSTSSIAGVGAARAQDLETALNTKTPQSNGMRWRGRLVAQLRTKNKSL